MPRYTDIDKLIAEYDRVHIGPAGGARKLMVEAPIADVVEVVRCCDCKYCETVIHSIIDEPKWFCTRMVRAFDVDPTCFCSYGERKE